MELDRRSFFSFFRSALTRIAWASTTRFLRSSPPRSLGSLDRFWEKRELVRFIALLKISTKNELMSSFQKNVCWIISKCSSKIPESYSKLTLELSGCTTKFCTLALGFTPASICTLALIGLTSASSILAGDSGAICFTGTVSRLRSEPEVTAVLLTESSDLLPLGVRGGVR